MDISGIYAGHVIKRKNKSDGREKGYNKIEHDEHVKQVLDVIINNPKITKTNLFNEVAFSTPTARACVNELLDADKIKERKVGRVKVLEAIE